MKINKLPKTQRQALRDRILKAIKKAGVINTRDLADKLGLKYSQVYLGLAHRTDVKEVRVKGRKAFWTTAETPVREARKLAADYKPSSSVRRGRPALAGA